MQYFFADAPMIFFNLVCEGVQQFLDTKYKINFALIKKILTNPSNKMKIFSYEYVGYQNRVNRVCGAYFGRNFFRHRILNVNVVKKFKSRT